jgi:serine/threonine-protein kinase RsbW
MAEYRLKLPSTVESGTRLLEQLERILRANNVGGTDLRRFMVIVSEAFTNALIHGNRLDSSKDVRVTLRVNDDVLAADIVDEGRGGVERVHSRETAGPLAEGGRGVDLIHYYASDVRFSDDDGGLKVSIEYARKRKDRANESL